MIIKQGKTNIKYLLIVIILAAIVGGGFLVYQYSLKECNSPADCEDKLHIMCVGQWECINNQCVWNCQVEEKQKLEEAELEDETTNWKTYRNEEYGFEIKYPENWEENPAPLPNLFFFGFPGWPNEYQVWVWISPDSHLDSYYGGEKDKACTKTFLSNKEAYRCEDEEYIYIEAENKGNFYFLSKSIEQFDIFERMLSTFRFIESSSPTSPAPIINSISLNSGPIGTSIEISGKNFTGFEGDLVAWIENINGEKGYIWREPGSDDALIKFTLSSSYCQVDTSYSGLPCPAFLSVATGVYKIYVNPWGVKSNEVTFTVTP